MNSEPVILKSVSDIKVWTLKFYEEKDVAHTMNIVK